MKKIFLLITIILVISSCSFWKENQETPNSSSWNTETLSSGVLEEKVTSSKIENKDDFKDINLWASWSEPFWNIKIVWNKLTYSFPGEKKVENKNYKLNSLKREWENMIFEWEKVKVNFEKKTCLSDWLGIELPYTVELNIENKTYKWCWEEVLDDFFVEWKTGKCNEIAKKTGLDRDDIKVDCEYSISAIYWPYFEVWFTYEIWWYIWVYKKTSDAYETVWEGQDVGIKDCVNVVNNHSRLVYNEKFPLLSDCEDRLKNAKWDEIDQIYESDKNDEVYESDNFTKTACNNSALALIREWTEVKAYIEDMEKTLWQNDENVWEVKDSLKNFGLEIEKVEKEALFFVLVESHKEEDWTERDVTTKSFRIKNDTLFPEEYNVISNDYDELTMTVSGEELEKLKNNYKKDCVIR